MGDAVELINGWIWPVLAAPAIGSFLGVLVRRLPAGRPIAAARSQCESCGATLTPRDMVPLASYLFLRGKCRHCGALIAPMHAVIELAALAIAAASALAVPAGPTLWLTCALGWWLLPLAWIDANTQHLPDVLTLPLLLAGLAEAAWRAPEDLPARALAAALAYTTFWLLALAYRHLRGREGLGLGDAKLLAAAGAWLGVLLLPYVVLLGALSALAFALIRTRGAVTATFRLPFGPFLAGAMWLVWIWGQKEGLLF
jgi:leader peptidase (prepilin peptidase)/N-methyltransferase